MSEEASNNDESKEISKPTIDKWMVQQFTREDNPHGMMEESSFTVLFPKYREEHFKEIWPYLIKKLAEHCLTATLDVMEGSVTVSNTKKTWDPFIVIKARDMMKLMARSVPYDKAVQILEDNVFSEVIKVKNLASNTGRFIKRRERLVGANGATLKALELLTECFIKVQGGTVTVVGPYKGIRAVRKVIEDTFYNIHPIYNIKALMVRNELLKDEKLQNEDWTRFIPLYKGQRVKNETTTKAGKKKKKPYTPFPPPQPESKIDKQLASGEYFMKSHNKKKLKERELREQQQIKAQKKRIEKMKRFQPPASRDDALKHSLNSHKNSHP